MIDLGKARLRFEELGLLSADSLLDSLLERVQHKSIRYLDFSNELLETELAERQERNIELRFKLALKLARVPYRKTLTEFDFTFQPSS